jgi:hypothetical protein
LKGVAIDSENARCLALTEMITIMKGSDESIFRKFIEEQEIHECVKIVSTKFMQKVKDQGFADVNLSEINNRAIMCLWEEIKRWSFPKVKKTTELKNYLIQTIFYRLFEWFLEDKYEIPRNKQNDLWRLQRARRELKRKSGANPTVEELIKKLGPKWDRKRIQEIITYEGRLGGFVDLKSEDEYLDKLTLNEDEHLDSSPDSVS